MRKSKPGESEILYYQKEERKREKERGRERGREGRREWENKRRLLVFMVKLSFEITTLGEVPVRAMASLGLVTVLDLPLYSQRGPGMPCPSWLGFPVVSLAALLSFWHSPGIQWTRERTLVAPDSRSPVIQVNWFLGCQGKTTTFPVSDHLFGVSPFPPWSPPWPP